MARNGYSPFLLVALLMVLVAVAIRFFLAQQAGEAEGSGGPGMPIIIAGIGSGLVAMLASIGALVDRRRAWPLAIFTALAGVGLAGMLVGDLQTPLARVIEDAKQAAAPGAAEARKPIPQEKGALTAAALEPALVAWGEETMVRPYQEHGHHDPAWEDAALEFIRQTVLELGESPKRPGSEHLRLLGASVLHTGCDDPWVLFLIHRLGTHDPDRRETMEAAASAIAGAGYPAFPVWFAQAEAVGAAQREDRENHSQLTAPCFGGLRGALSARPLNAADFRIWCALFLHDVGSGLLKADGEGTCHAVESVSATPEWFRLWIRGRMEIEQAWLARGSGWANSVNDSQWKLFSEHLAAGRQALERALQLQPGQPEIARTLMKVELGSTGIEPMRRRFDASVKAQFDYMEAYDSMRVGLLPRWFGSSEALLAFGRDCLATQRFDTEVPWQMIRAVEDVAKDQDDTDDYYMHRVPWDDIMATLDGYLAHGDPARRNYYLSVKLHLAAARRMDAIVDQTLMQLDYHIDPQVVKDANLQVEWLERMAAMHGPAQSELIASEAVETKDRAQAVKHLLAAQKIPNLSPIATTYIDEVLGDAQAIVALSRVPWRPLTPPQDLSGWKVVSGEWKVVAPGVLEAKTGESGALLTRVEPIGDTWEVRGQFDFVSQQSGRTEGAVFCGPPDDQEKHGFSLRFWQSPSNWSGISLARGFRDEAISKTAGFERSTQFFIRMAYQRLRVSATDGLWFADQPVPEGAKIEPGALLSLGSTTGAGRTIQFQNLEWRAASLEDVGVQK